MEGILCIDKPVQHTSFDVVARMRGIAKTKKIGHGGTLDPMATGVLPLFFGRAAKACDILPDQDKTYLASFRLGITTDTQDITGTVLSKRPVEVGKAQVAQMLDTFLGAQKQIPPMYSAVRINGQRLYDLAREGKTIDRPARDVVFHRISMQDADPVAGEYQIEVSCSKGAYIRTLCHDIGEQLGCGAALTALRRTRACGFGIEDCITLEQAADLQQKGLLEAAVLPIAAVFRDLPRLVLTRKQVGYFRNGVAMTLNQFESPIDSMVAVYCDADDTLIGLGSPDAEGRCLKQVRLFSLGV